MGQVAFDTLQFVETLESAGLPKEQARAISVAVRQSHEAVDVATSVTWMNPIRSFQRK